MKTTLALALGAFLLPFALLNPAYADDDNDRKQSPSGAFNPTLKDSPVNVIFCTVPDSCKIQPPKEKS